ncbi:GNAT family N-acetyltransferase [Streptomyces sp. bgisy022]|uniref:GNAT family N-acetyltransferase n=1 Tax=Streptomyces sp. bgisy022 TaxID=3413769 RepID=UPI003D73A1FF
MQNESAIGAGARLRVRRRNGHDLAACVRLLADVHERDGYPADWPRLPEAWLTPPALLKAWVAVSDGRLAGHVALSRGGAGDAAPALWSARTGAGTDTTAVVGRLFVSPGARGRGVGALLLARAASQAHRHGLHPVLDVAVSDTAACALYERLGRRLLGTVRQDWGARQGVVVRCYAAAPPPARPTARPGTGPGATPARRSS